MTSLELAKMEKVMLGVAEVCRYSLRTETDPAERAKMKDTLAGAKLTLEYIHRIQQDRAARKSKVISGPRARMAK